MTKKMILHPSRRLAIVLGLCILASAGVANAETSRQGFYAGIELGFANAEDMGSVLSGVNHPTQCDILVGGDPSGPGCADNTPRPFSITSFDLGTGFLGGVSVGYALDRFRVEFEYLNRSHSGDSLPWKPPGGNTALVGQKFRVEHARPALGTDIGLQCSSIFRERLLRLSEQLALDSLCGRGRRLGPHQSGLRGPLFA